MDAYVHSFWSKSSFLGLLLWLHSFSTHLLDMRTLTELVESGALKPLVDARDFELTTDGVGDIVKASMTHRTKGKLVLTVSKQ